VIIKEVRVRNYRLLKDVQMTLDERSTLVVGRNNTGKTSLAEIFRSFLAGPAPKLKYEDFNQSSLSEFETALVAFQAEVAEEEVRPQIPAIELELLVDYRDDADAYGVLGDFIRPEHPFVLNWNRNLINAEIGLNFKKIYCTRP
jgi:putative ATP-dependent endonuclease of OLD family